MQEIAKWERDGAVAILTINNPPVNAISREVRAALVEGVNRAAKDDDVEGVYWNEFGHIARSLYAAFMGRTPDSARANRIFCKFCGFEGCVTAHKCFVLLSFFCLLRLLRQNRQKSLQIFTGSLYFSLDFGTYLVTTL